MRKKGGLSDFKRGMVVGGREAGLSISEPAGIFPTQRYGMGMCDCQWKWVTSGCYRCDC